MYNYPHMCCMGHQEIGHSDSDSELCPLCAAYGELEWMAEQGVHPAVVEHINKFLVRVGWHSDQAGKSHE